MAAAPRHARQHDDPVEVNDEIRMMKQAQGLQPLGLNDYIIFQSTPAYC